MATHNLDKLVTEQLRPFAAHGVVFHGVTGNQAYGDCPFTGKHDKFYVNLTNLLWDTKTGGLSGDLFRFLDYTAQRYQKNLPTFRLNNLANNRQLPLSAFEDWGIGWTDSMYTLPVKNTEGRVQDIRLYRRGGKCLSTPGCKTGLLGAHHLSLHPGVPIYVCEGEWDGVALAWLLKKLGLAGVAVAVPGASVFKQEWVPWFTQRTVYACYDNDAPGEEGERVFTKRLFGTARTLKYLHWPSATPEKFDVRDWVVRVAIHNQRPRECWQGLTEMFRDAPRPYSHGQPGQTTSPPIVVTPTVTPTVYKTPPSLDQVFRVFKKWLFLETTDPIEVMLAVMMSNTIEGDPLWMFLVSPPGGAKTETLTSLSQCDNVFMVSSLTSHSLISGATWSNGADPSLIPKLNGRVLVIKDFTSILSIHPQERDAIFAILRDAYDGRCSKVFGTGVTRSYLSRFSILAAVTPSIYEAVARHQSLGERFLKFLVGDNLEHHSETDIILRSIQNVNQELQMRQELSDVVTAFVKRPLPTTLPTIPTEMHSRLVALSQFGARMRGVVPRDTFRSDIILNRPMAEIGSRIGKQLAKLAISLALVRQKSEVTDTEFRLVRKTMLDTIPQRNEDIVRWVYLKTPHSDDALRTKEVSVITKYPLATVSRILGDMFILGIMDRIGTAIAHKWRLSKYMLDSIRAADIYKGEQHGA